MAGKGVHVIIHGASTAAAGVGAQVWPKSQGLTPPY
jgi:hypothetical protein